MWSCRGAVAAAVVGVLALVGCTPAAEPPATPSPTPSATQRPETKIEREQRVAYEAAEQAYRTSLQELGDLLRDGGRSSPSASLRAVATGPFLADMAFLLENYREGGLKRSGEAVITRINRNGYEPSELLLVTCVDGRGIETLDGNKKVIRRGVQAVNDVVARKNDGRWQIYSSKGRSPSSGPA